MTSILKTDEIQSQNGGAVVKMQTLKHPSSSGNNLELASDGSTTITNGTLSAGTIGSGVVLDQAHPSTVFYMNAGHTGNARIGNWVKETGTGVSGEGSSVDFDTTNKYFYFPTTGVYIFYFNCRTYLTEGNNDNQININTIISNDQGATANQTFVSTNSFNEDPINPGDAYSQIGNQVLVNVSVAGDTSTSTVLYLETQSFSGSINSSTSSNKQTWCHFYRISNT